MHTIERSIEIAASLTSLRTAITTSEGFRAWLAADTQVDAAGRYSFPFGPRAVTFTLDRTDDRGITMTCVDALDNPDWLNTKLAITLTPTAGGKTRVDLVHAGYASKNECYARSIQGWDYFMSSLSLYATTGQGTPFGAKAAEPAPVRAAAEVAS
jgi:uncharacterized protein YndB with AHSA1/START domain